MPRVVKIIMLSLFLALLLGSSMVFAQERLIFAVTLIRHGDRTAVYEIAAIPYTWTQGLGELTPIGMHQEYLQGQRLRTRYVDELQLLPQNYQNNSIFARSSDINRTIMSAQAFLCGLYPPGTGPLLNDDNPALPSAYQPIPVRTMPEDQDPIIRGEKVYEKRLNEMVHAYVLPSAEWQKMSLSYADKFDRWSQIFGFKIESLLDLKKPGDNLNVMLLKGIPLPKGLSEEEAREIVKISQWVMAQLYKPRRIGRFIAGDFIEDVINNMQKAIEGTQEHKFILYSGHDTSILPAMSALGAPLEATPPYASNMCFELYQDKDDYHVKVRYNGMDIAMPCVGGKTVCSFKEFREVVLKEI